ncbi:undecaprenyl-diphosphate phosphatase [Sulfuricurvum sp.]|uniref:undecaprenyl-diphosphate phosphatase n=1 Tax=Sulfuricurvum sp. TaxID=2025608 RepID=UPI00261E9A55|nr:undecaprenyl-diphosphate phosphatase [Sulfuricurvum sp.]MDD2267831.1 undecaprenyl-diphosphate phosphatase [Sulfuricurvum sp.]MDD2784365.1 undecaprenyl-diphosphate phosphatase [Sulfuricurvum sp.]
MDIVQSVIMGVVEGFTEFLPVSSTGHMIVLSDFLGIEQDSVTKAYEIIIQFAAILAVVLNYREKFSPQKIDLWMKLAVAFFPIGAVGFLFAKHIKELFSVPVVAVMFIVGGIVFLIAEYYYKPKEHFIDDVEKVTYKQALWIGIAQVFALIPGTSRAGATIIGAMMVGLTRKASAEFSFLLAFPVMCATTGYDIVKHHNEFAGSNLTVLLVGFVVSFGVAYLTIKLFLKFLEQFTFVSFGIYRIIFGAVLLMVYR